MQQEIKRPQSWAMQLQSNKENYAPVVVRAIIENVDYPGVNCFIYVHPDDFSEKLVESAWRTRVRCQHSESDAEVYEQVELYAYTDEYLARLRNPQSQRRKSQFASKREYNEWYARLEDIASGRAHSSIADDED